MKLYPFGQLDETVFEFCAQTLVKLDLSETSFFSLVKGLFKRLVNLKELNLSDIKLGDVHFDLEFLSGIEAKLEVLDLSRKKLLKFLESKSSKASFPTQKSGKPFFETIQPSTFDRFMRLVNLDLSRNELAFLEKECFRSLVNLETLNLSHNKIRGIEPGAFDGLAKLTRLDLVGVFMTTLSTGGAFQGLDNLEELNLNFSLVLSEIEPRALQGLSGLKILDLSSKF